MEGRSRNNHWKSMIHAIYTVSSGQPGIYSKTTYQTSLAANICNLNTQETETGELR